MIIATPTVVIMLASYLETSPDAMKRIKATIIRNTARIQVATKDIMLITQRRVEPAFGFDCGSGFFDFE